MAGGLTSSCLFLKEGKNERINKGKTLDNQHNPWFIDFKRIFIMDVNEKKMLLQESSKLS